MLAPQNSVPRLSLRPIDLVEDAAISRWSLGLVFGQAIAANALRLIRRAAGCKILVEVWDHCPERANGRDNGPILRYFSFCRSP